MTMRYLYQVVFCSSRVGRCFRREIAFTDVSAMVTAVEPLPPAYHVVMENIRRDNEEIRYIPNLKVMRDYAGCPFCGNRTVFFCKKCRVYSCVTSEPHKHHCCPVCREIYETLKVEGYYVTESGMLGPERELGGPVSPREVGGQSSPSSPARPRMIPDLTSPYRVPGADGDLRLPPGDGTGRLPPAGGPKMLPPGSGEDAPKRLPPEAARKNLQEFLKKKKKK